MVDLNYDIVADIGMLSQYRTQTRKLTLVAAIALMTISVTPKSNLEIPAKIMREKLNSDHELNMNLMIGLFEQLYDQFLEFCSHTSAKRKYKSKFIICHRIDDFQIK